MTEFSAGKRIMDWTGIWQWAVLAGLVGALYLDPLTKLAADLWHDSNYSHGLLVPFISLYLIFKRREELLAAPPAPCNLGLPVIILALFLYIAGYIGAELFSRRISLLVLLWGLALFLQGGKIAGILFLPIAFLFFAVPLPYVLYNSIAFPLKLIASQIAAWMLMALGLPVYREGNIIHLAQTTLEVVDACSGIRSLMTLVTLAFVLAYLLQKAAWRRSLLVMSALPIAVLANTGRVTITGLLANQGYEVTSGFTHDALGWVAFVLAFLLLIGMSGLIKEKGKL